MILGTLHLVAGMNFKTMKFLNIFIITVMIDFYSPSWQFVLLERAASYMKPLPGEKVRICVQLPFLRVLLSIYEYIVPDEFSCVCFIGSAEAFQVILRHKLHGTATTFSFFIQPNTTTLQLNANSRNTTQLAHSMHLNYHATHITE